MEKGIVFSIIIPHHNIPELLGRCLRSIPERDDIQVIVVDDNSTDADTYKERVPELNRKGVEFVRTKEGKGAGYARNMGLERVRGEWLLFADADDFFVENVGEMLDRYKNSDADLIAFKMRTVYSDNITKAAHRSGYINKIIDQFLADGDEAPVRALLEIVWCKMIRMEQVRQHGIKFEEVPFSNDYHFSAHVGCEAKRIEVSAETLYVVTRRSDSLTDHFAKKPGELEKRAEVYFRVQKYLRSQNIQLKHWPFAFFYYRMFRYDRALYRRYLHLADEIYPSKWEAVKDTLSRIQHSRISLLGRWWISLRLWLYSLPHACGLVR